MNQPASPTEVLRESATMLLTHADRVREIYPDRAEEILQLAAQTIDHLESDGEVAQ